MALTDDEKDTLVGFAVRVDGLRAAGLRFLDQAVRARQAGSEREHRRLSRRLGADHPRVKSMALRIAADAALRRELVMDVARAEMVTPRRSRDEWALHGFLLWKDLSPAADLTVSLVDARGQWLQSLGFACTDARGYFQLVAPVGREPGGQQPAADATARYPIEGWIRVTDVSRSQLHREAEPSSVGAGETEYREIVLGDEAGPRCAPPEEASGPEPGPEKKKTPLPRKAKTRRRS